MYIGFNLNKKMQCRAEYLNRVKNGDVTVIKQEITLIVRDRRIRVLT